MTRPAILLTVALLAAAGVAQRPPNTVPVEFTAVEAPGLAFWALSPFDAHRQLVLGPRHTAQLVGSILRSITVRRNGDGDALPSGRLHLQVWMSHAARTPLSASPAFAQNRGPDHSMVHDGWVSLPASPAPTAAPPAWSGSDAVRITLQTPFVFATGPLCIETLTRTDPTVEPAPWWPIDAVVDPVAGQAVTFGVNCVPGPRAAPAAIDANSLALGGSAAMSLASDLGRVTPALCLLGTNATAFGALRLPLDLTPLGAPGCLLLTNSLASLPAPLQPLPDGGSLAVALLPIPSVPAFAGVALYTQWAVLDAGLNPFGVATSNGVQAVLGAAPPRWDAAWIESTDLAAPAGVVLTGRVPVLQFGH